ncbi:hypothetical protein Q3G72_026217 [Acer saccharum]|nr:hypothetical protein Q3G72_026217 [Acer saccharum]
MDLIIKKISLLRRCGCDSPSSFDGREWNAVVANASSLLQAPHLMYSFPLVASTTIAALAVVVVAAMDLIIDEISLLRRRGHDGSSSFGGRGWNADFAKASSLQHASPPVHFTPPVASTTTTAPAGSIVPISSN